mgnify:FL=1
MVNDINTDCSIELKVNEPSILKFIVIERNDKIKQGIIISNAVLINSFIVLNNLL